MLKAADKVSKDDTYPDHTLDVTMTFSIVNWSQLRGSLTVLVVALEDTTGTLTLAPDDSSHGLL